MLWFSYLRANRRNNNELVERERWREEKDRVDNAWQWHELTKLSHGAQAASSTLTSCSHISVASQAINELWLWFWFCANYQKADWPRCLPCPAPGTVLGASQVTKDSSQEKASKGKKNTTTWPAKYANAPHPSCCCCCSALLPFGQTNNHIWPLRLTDNKSWPGNPRLNHLTLLHPRHTAGLQSFWLLSANLLSTWRAQQKFAVPEHNRRMREVEWVKLVRLGGDYAKWFEYKDTIWRQKSLKLARIGSWSVVTNISKSHKKFVINLDLQNGLAKFF